jgi:hypothetical protein
VNVTSHGERQPNSIESTAAGQLAFVDSINFRALRCQLIDDISQKYYRSTSSRNENANHFEPGPHKNIKPNHQRDLRNKFNIYNKVLYYHLSTQQSE